MIDDAVTVDELVAKPDDLPVVRNAFESRLVDSPKLRHCFTDDTEIPMHCISQPAKSKVILLSAIVDVLLDCPSGVEDILQVFCGFRLHRA